MEPKMTNSFFVLGVPLQIASSFLLATLGRAVRCIFIFLKKKIKDAASIPHANPK
jgi:hypothetical protein